MDDLKAYRDERNAALIGAMGGGAIGGGKGLYDLMQEYKNALGPLIDDGNILSLRKRKPNLGKYVAQNPRLMKEVLSKGAKGALTGAAKWGAAGGIGGLLLPYLVNEEAHGIE